MSKRLLNQVLLRRNFEFLKYESNKRVTNWRLLSTNDETSKSLKKIDDENKKTDQSMPEKKGVESEWVLQKYLNKIRNKKEEQQEERKGPFKNYFEYEEREKKSIMFYEDFIDRNCKEKNRENFMTAIDIFKQTNPTKQLYLDFIYGALLKMKEYDAHTQLEAYRKLMEIFPIGPLLYKNVWQRDNMHFPRHQNCAIQILEQMEKNGVMLDEEFVNLAISIFGDWTHVVRKAKRQLYWLPKFKNANPYPVPSYDKFEKMSDLELAKVALERMCFYADNSTKIEVNFSKELNENEEEDTWFATAQSETQVELLKKHPKKEPIYVEGPYVTYVRSKQIEYFIMKSDPLPVTLEKIKKLNSIDLDDVKNMPNMFDNPFGKTTTTDKLVSLNVHELPEGNIYAICCTGTSSKNSLYNWTKLLESKIDYLKDCLVVYKVKEKVNYLVDVDKLKNAQQSDKQKTQQK